MELAKYSADAAMYTAPAIPEESKGGRVTLLNATPDPLGSVAALCKAYKGEVVRSLAEVTDQERREFFEDMTRTVLSGPLESVQFHFLVEGYSRALVDQMTRGRAGFYAVESLRFAVKEGFADELPLPPSLAALPADDVLRRVWHKGVYGVETMYHALIQHGIPAEDARRMLPIGIATRAHWVCDLRELLSVAGKRLCTQAEFEWRGLMAQVIQELRRYWLKTTSCDGKSCGDEGGYHNAHLAVPRNEGWQFDAIADKLQPVCYQTGHCGFMAQFDRGCKIRARVEDNARIGRPSSEWDKPYYDEDYAVGPPEVPAIRREEWLSDPEAAR